MDDFARLNQRLCDVSRAGFTNPYACLEWPERLDPGAWCMSPELLSLYGTETYEGLTEAWRRRLSFFEAVNFFSLNIHGEKALVAGIAQRLYRPEWRAVSPYLQHFLDEENKHMVLFGGFCERYAGKIYADRKVAVPAEHAPGEEDFLFFARILVFEEIVDQYNVAIARDTRVAPVAREINRLHHRDESRHLSFGRQFVRRLFDAAAPAWAPPTLQAVREQLRAYITAVWKEYHNPDVYRDAGLPDPYGLCASSYASAPCRERRRALTRPCLRYFIDNGILDAEPTP